MKLKIEKDKPLEFKAFFGTLILMGWIYPSKNKEILVAPTNFKYNLGIMYSTFEDQYVIFNPKWNRDKHFPSKWIDKYYSARELLNLIQ